MSASSRCRLRLAPRRVRPAVWVSFPLLWWLSPHPVVRGRFGFAFSWRPDRRGVSGVRWGWEGRWLAGS